MNFEKRFPHQEVVRKERAIALGHAANTLDGVKVRVLANEGEKYTHFHDGLGIERSEIVHSTVDPGDAQIEITPARAVGEVHQAADDLAESSQEQAA